MSIQHHLLRAAKRLVPAPLYLSALLRREIRRKTSSRVHTGPFAGMRYVEEAVGSAYIPKLLGTYERELEPALESILETAPPYVINIGGAEGYYAVGLARRLPAAEVRVFEQTDRGRELIEEMARVNGVGDRVDVAGECGPDNLNCSLKGHPTGLLVCDVEGFEVDLLDPDRVDGLEGWVMIVEVHEAERPGCSAALEEYYAATHRISRVEQRVPDVREYPFEDSWSRFFSRGLLRWGLAEFRRPGNGWLVLYPRGI